MGRYVLAPSIKDYQAQEKTVFMDDHGYTHLVITEIEKRKQAQALHDLFQAKVVAKRLACGLQVLPCSGAKVA